MLRVNGFYGHVERNNLRSAAMFGGFLVAYQLVAAVVLFLPLLVIDPLHAPLVFGVSGYAGRYAPLVLAASGALFLARFLRHVASVRSTVAFDYVDRWTHPRLVGAVETQAIAAGLPPPKVGLIDSPARNAFACGFGARSAVVVATRGLVEALDDDELAAVVAHEVAHIRNGDIRLMAAADVLMDNLERLRRRNPLRIGGWKRALLAVLLPPYLFLCLAAGLVTTAAFTLARVSRLLISSSREFVADAEAVRMTHDPAALISALRRVEGRSAVEGVGPRADAMMIDGAVEGAFASHPTIAERIAVLERLSGAMAHAAAPARRRDTRPAEQVAAAGRGGASGPRGAPGPATAPPRRASLASRVNAGSRENAFGLAPGVRRLMALGFAGIAALQLWAMFQHREVPGGAEAVARLREAAHALPAEAGSLRGGYTGTFAVAGAAGRTPQAAAKQELQRLAATDPAGAGCFATEAYRVGDRGLHELHPPDPRLVELFSAGEVFGSSDIALERYLGHKARSARAAARARDADLDQALLAYVTTRKSLLWVLHRFFGEPGLRFMLEAYDSPEDRAVLDALRRRLHDRAPALVADKRLAAEIGLLVSAPGGFVPCMARAG